jgi:hypothetical protein
MDVINRDFQKLNYDTSFIPNIFKPLASKTDIQFGLAHRKPDGTSTPGWEIITTTATGYDINDGWGASKAKHAADGGADAWDVSKYLNIWVVNVTPNGILGFTDPPSFLGFPGFPSGELGIVITHLAFGKRTSGSQAFLSGIDRGRTLTHELGHFFELEHVWGDDNGLCPTNGGSDDGINDTPPQALENYGYPTFPHVSCSNSAAGGDMFMNYMDYTNDSAMHMFTIQQANVMNSKVGPGGESVSLTQHPEILEWPTAVNDIENMSNFDIYPNPTSGTFQISFTNVKELQKITVSNMLGQTVKTIDINNSATANYNVDLTGLNKGVYLIQCTFTGGTLTKKILLQ